MIGTSGINVANCYKSYGGTVDVLQVRCVLLLFPVFVARDCPSLSRGCCSRVECPKDSRSLNILPKRGLLAGIARPCVEQPLFVL